MRLGKRIRELREALGISQEDFAHANNFGRSYYARLEAGKVNICLRNLERLADGLGVSVRDLFDFD